MDAVIATGYMGDRIVIRSRIDKQTRELSIGVIVGFSVKIRNRMNVAFSYYRFNKSIESVKNRIVLTGC
ncbi:hypothetical protein ANTPLA_LOCUS6688 [Anthophora plagiata]